MPDNHKRCVALLKKAGCSDRVIGHCEAVCARALDFSKTCDLADSTLVETGALLHDIGRSSTHSIGHAQRGADILRKKKFPDEVVRIVECHTGAGLTADECTLLGLSPRDCMPETIEQKIVTNADNLIAGVRLTTIEEELADAIRLPRKTRKRMYRLACEVDLLTQ